MNWDTIGIMEAKHHKEFKTSLTTLQNKYVKCNKEYCYSCRQYLNSTIIFYNIYHYCDICSNLYMTDESVL